MPTKRELRQVLGDYAARSSIHGIGYIFDKQLGLGDRALWLVAIMCAVVLAMWMICSTYTGWQTNQVITTLKTTTKPTTDMEFPSVIICGNGLHMDLVEKVLYANFNNWKASKSNSDDSAAQNELFSVFMNETFQIENEMSILDILTTMISPEAAERNTVKKNEIACAGGKRKKRAISKSLTI